MSVFKKTSKLFALVLYISLSWIVPVGCLATASDWSALSTELQGRLQAVTPLAAPCFPTGTTINQTSEQTRTAECLAVEEGYLNDTFRTDHFAGFYHLYGDGCASDPADQCFLDPDNLTANSSTGACHRGTLAQYYINIQSAGDVQTAFKFARRTRMPLSIKASGHDYLTRSSLKGSLALWTRNLKEMAYEPQFRAHGSPDSAVAVAALTLGAGVNAAEAYTFAASKNVTLVGPSSPTVTVVGGWSLFGGHSVLSPLFGLGADRLLEIDIVTADGELRTCNAYQDADLFWALRGGGGGALGVVLRATVKVEPAMSFTLAVMSFPPTADNQDAFVSQLIESTPAWASEGWGGRMSSSTLALITPLLDETAANDSMAAAAAHVRANNGTVVISRLGSFQEFYDRFLAPAAGDIAKGALLPFRVLNRRLHETPSGRDQLAGFIGEQLAAHNRTPSIMFTPPSQFAYAEGSTSVHPAWRDAYWDLGYAMSYSWDSDVDERRTAARDAQQLSLDLAELAPDGAAYPNEAQPWQQDWQSEFWGVNYGRLAEVKARYDPDGLLTCWKCVGFQDSWIRERGEYRCIGAFEGLV